MSQLNCRPLMPESQELGDEGAEIDGCEARRLDEPVGTIVVADGHIHAWLQAWMWPSATTIVPTGSSSRRALQPSISAPSSPSSCDSGISGRQFSWDIKAVDYIG